MSDEQIAQVLLSQGLPVPDVAKRVGVSIYQVQRVNARESRRVIRIARSLGIPKRVAGHSPYGKYQLWA